MIRRAVALGILAAAALLGGPASAKPTLGKPAPGFTLRLFNGESVTLESLRGQVVVLNFWATWCAPCRKELPTLDAFYQLTSQHGLRVFAIATEDSVPAYKLKPLQGMLKIPFVRAMKGGYGIIEALPTNYVIDRAGVVRYAKAGAFDLDDLNRILIPLLNEHAPAAAQP